MIPKIIHYCWLSDDPVPRNLKKYMKSWKKKLPDYEFIKWDFNKFDKHSSKWVSDAFDNKKYAFAADYIRLFAVYNYGGIYMDMDVEVIKSFNDLLERKELIAFSNERLNDIEAGCFGAEKNNQFIGDCLECYKSLSFIDENGKMNLKTSPARMMEVYAEKKYEFKILGNDYFSARSFDTGEIAVTNNTHCIHHFAGSWRSPKGMKKRKLKYRMYKMIGPDYESTKRFKIAEALYVHGLKYTIKMVRKYIAR